MKITVVGKPKGISKENIKLAADHFSEKLLTKRLSKTITTVIKFVDRNNCGDDLGPNDVAVCVPDYDSGTSRPKDFTIIIDKGMNRKLTLTSLAHEFVHLKQYARTELFEYHHSGLSKWKGTIHNTEAKHREYEYWFQPWEIEAMGMEQGLVRSFVGKIKEMKSK